MMTNDDERGEGGKKCPKFDDVICERPLSDKSCGSKKIMSQNFIYYTSLKRSN